jgi:3-hydroxyisobutyrate dehydrogenase
MMKKIAVIGTGIMGNGIVTNYLKNGYQVYVWNRTKDKLAALISAGAIAVNSPKEAAEKAKIILEVTANDASSREVWFGAAGILAAATPAKVLITNATLSVSWVDELAAECHKRGFTFFDMPMTGGRVGAENGKLILLVGGDENKLKELGFDLKAISAEIVYFGKAGSGMRYKLILNMLQAIHMTGLGEALKLAASLGLDLKKVGNALSERPGGTTTNVAWRDYQTEPDPINFSVEWITKDLTYTKQAANNSAMPLLDVTLHKFNAAMEQGMGQKDWTSVNKMD